MKIAHRLRHHSTSRPDGRYVEGCSANAGTPARANIDTPDAGDQRHLGRLPGRWCQNGAAKRSTRQSPAAWCPARIRDGRSSRTSSATLRRGEGDYHAAWIHCTTIPDSRPPRRRAAGAVLEEIRGRAPYARAGGNIPSAPSCAISACIRSSSALAWTMSYLRAERIPA